MPTNRDEFTPVAEAPAVNWDEFQPVADAKPREDSARIAREELARLQSQPEAGLAAGFVANETEVLANAAKGAAQVVPSTLRTIGQTAAWLGRKTGLGETDATKTGTYQLGEAAQRQLDKLPTGQGQEDSFLLQDLPQAIGQMGSMMATGGGVKALGAGARVAGLTASGTGFGQEFDDAMQSATARGDQPDTAFAKSLGYASVATMIENLAGAGRIFRKYFPQPEAAAQVLTKAGISKDIAANFLAGYAEEAGQRIAQNVIVNEAGTPADLLAGANREGLAGALVQGTVALPTAAIQPPTTANRSETPNSSTGETGQYPLGPGFQTPDGQPVQAPGQPTAIFQGPNGQEIRVQLGTATLDQVQEMIFRTQPGATFVGAENLSPSPAADSIIPPPTSPQAGSATVEASPAAPAEDPIDYSPMDTAGGTEINWDEFTPVDNGTEKAQSELAGAETITGSNAQQGAEMPAESGASPGPIQPKLSKTARRNNDRPPDLIDHALDNVGMIDPTLIREADPNWKPVGAARKLFKVGGVPADVAANALADLGHYKDDPGQLDQFGAALNASATGRIGDRKQASQANRQITTEAKQADQFGQKVLQGKRPKAEADKVETVPVGNLVQGDTFEVQGHKFTVEEMTWDEDGNLTHVRLKDGPKFGVQDLDGTEVLHFDRGTLVTSGQAVEFLAPEDLEPAPVQESLPVEPAPTVPKLRPGEKGTGDLLQGDNDVFNLAGEQGLDAERLAKEQAAKAAAAKADAEFQAKATKDLFAAPAAEFGANNTLISSTKAEELRQRLREKLGGKRLNTGVDPTIFTDAVQLGVYYLEGGIRAFPAWSAKMIDDLGDGIRPWLRSVYEGARSFPGANYEDNMDTPDRVRELHKSYVTGANPSLERAGEGASQPAGQPGTGNLQPAQPGPGGASAGSLGGQPEAFPAEPDHPLGAGGDLPVDAGQRGNPVVSGQQPVAGGSVAEPGGRADTGGRSGVNESGASIGSQSDLGTPGVPKVTSDAPKLEERPGQSNQERAELQKQAELGAVQVADLENIQATLPILLPPQQLDVLKAERRFFVEQPVAPQSGSAEGLGDPKRGILYTNGTGTGKTFTGLGIVKRFVKMGKGNVLIVAPTQTVVDSWQKEGKLFLLDITALPDTSNAGTGVVVTTYANFRQNEALLTRDFNLVVMDECHHILSNEAGEFTAGIQAFRQNANHPSLVHWKAARKVVGPQPSEADFKTKDQFLAAMRGYVTAVERNKLLINREVERLNAINTRTVFLSATPFAYHKSLQLVDGFLYSLPSDEGRSGYNTPRGFDRVLVESFGYRMRYGKVTQPEQTVRVDLMEMAFNDALVKRGSISGRIIDVPTDYSREFIIVDSELGRTIDEGFKFLGSHDAYEKYPGLYAVFRKFWDYNQKAQLLEALKMAEAIPRIHEHIKLGRKIILFHTYIQSGTTVHPFRFTTYQDAEFVAGQAGVSSADFQKEMAGFAVEFPAWVSMEMPSMGRSLDRIAQEFGRAAVFFNGTVSARKRAEGVIDFNKDGNGVNLIVAQLQAGKEGISLHDRTGKHQRVVMIAALPNRPTDAVQAEGRAYRIGVVTNAVYEYLCLHSLMERFQFGSKINEKVSTVESLALGSLARNLRERFKDAYLNATDSAPSEQQGSGGKQSDRRAESASDFEKAKTFYFGRLKKNSRTKSAEGVDYFATPEPLGLKMVEWARPRTGEHTLEPSAGHGAIGRFFPETTSRTYVEPSAELRSELGVKISGGRVVASTFEDLDIVNKYDVIVMNPPFGLGGSKAIAHLAKAAWLHLRDGGRIVALIPEGPAADARFEKFMEDERSRHLYVRRSLGLPTSTFERAGTSVKTRIVIIDRSDRVGLESQGRIDFRGDENINEFFDAIEGARLRL